MRTFELVLSLQIIAAFLVGALAGDSAVHAQAGGVNRQTSGGSSFSTPSLAGPSVVRTDGFSSAEASGAFGGNKTVNSAEPSRFGRGGGQFGGHRRAAPNLNAGFLGGGAGPFSSSGSGQGGLISRPTLFTPLGTTTQGLNLPMRVNTQTPSVMHQLMYETRTGRPLGLEGGRIDDQGVVGYRTWEQPELAVRLPSLPGSTELLPPVTPALGPAGEDGDTTIPLDALLEQYVSARRDAYLERGWEQFRQGDYRGACDTFSMADAVSIDGTDAKAQAKLALVYASLASGQYGLATGSLGWLLETRLGASAEDPRGLRGEGAFRELGDVQARYRNTDDYNQHANAVRALGTSDEEARALQAVIKWASPLPHVRSEALNTARQLRDSGTLSRWGRLYELLAQASESPRGTGSDPAGRSPGGAPMDVPVPVGLYERGAGR